MNSGFKNKQCECIVAKWNPESMHKIFLVKHESEIAIEFLLDYNKNLEMTVLYDLIEVCFGFLSLFYFFTVNFEFWETKDKKLRIFIILCVE